MKKPMLLLAAALLALTLRAQDDTPAPAPAAPAPTTTDDNDPAAHQGYQPTRYEDLWTKSPFAVETPDEVVTDTAEYSLVGVAQIHGVTYVSLVQKQNNAHLLVSSDQALGGLSLTSVSNKSDGVYASLMQNGQPLTLKLEAAPAGGPAQPAAGGNMPAVFNPQPPGGQSIPMPGAFNPNTARPMTHIRRPLIHVPGRFPNQQNDASAPTPAPAPAAAGAPAGGTGQPNPPPPAPAP